ncbi:MAG: putative HTH-type transcriptional regulator YxaF [Pseudomonadota bacterium]|jgi:AcrR family transcriptional regulator
MATGSRREHLIHTALAVFTERGFHGIGIDSLLQRAGMSKRTLYTHFKSKDELILAALRLQDELLRERLARDVAPVEMSAEDRLLAVFDRAADWFARPDFHGCVFVKAVGELAESSPPVRMLAREYKALMRSHLQALSQVVGVVDPDALADQMALLMEGAVVTAQVAGTSQAAQTARRIAKLLLDEAPRHQRH